MQSIARTAARTALRSNLRRGAIRTMASEPQTPTATPAAGKKPLMKEFKIYRWVRTPSLLHSN